MSVIEISLQKKKCKIIIVINCVVDYLKRMYI